ncbi:MAG: helix-turn-helix transcriptional regulator [bacterium]|nr:helix-turn-helix transcriptional regulator [bacterium]
MARARLRDGPALSHVRGVTTLDMGAIDPASINRNAFSYFNRLKRVERFVQAHYAEDISRKAVAEVAALEEKYFSTFFREKTGVRFRDWLTLVRVSRAMALLRSRNHPISIVASQAGFHSLRTFERSFKRCTGVTPRRYRKHAIAL